MKHTLTRRSLLGGAAAATALLASPRAARSSGPDQHVLVVLFLRGGADALSLMIPNEGHGRHLYDTDWRPEGAGGTPIHIHSSQGSYSGPAERQGIALGGSHFDTHPSLRALVEGPFAQRHLSFVGGVAAPNQNRSHFQQMDLIETGSPDLVPRNDGYLARAAAAMNLQAEPLALLALNATVPRSLEGSPRGLAIEDLATFGTLQDEDYVARSNWGLTNRIRRGFNTDGCSDLAIQCAAARKANGALGAIDSLNDTLESGAGLRHQLLSLSEVIDKDTDGRLRICTLDVGGWDMHTDLSQQIAPSLTMLGDALTAFHDDLVARGLLGRVTLVCHTEFGRRVDQNGSDGADHGYGGVALVMDEAIRSRVKRGNFLPREAGHDYYQRSELVDGRVLPKTMDIRRLLAEPMIHRMGMTGAQVDAVFPGRPNGAAGVLEI